MTLGVLLSVFVIAVVFGTVSAFVTNYYSYSGWQGISKKVCIFYKLRILLLYGRLMPAWRTRVATSSTRGRVWRRCW